MGALYGNITLRGPSLEEVAEALRGRAALVTPSVRNCTVVFDSVCDEQEIAGIQALTLKLSGDFHCPALAVIVHDDDALAYFLYQDGKPTDCYNSCPDYFDFGSTNEPRGPAGGNAAILCAAFGAGERDEVENILRAPRGKYVFETERHRDFVRALALPKFAVGKALGSFDRGEYPEELTAGQMLRAANPPPAEDRQRRLDRKFYDGLGVEDLLRPCKREGCHRGAIPNSVMCKRHHFEMIFRRDCPFDDA